MGVTGLWKLIDPCGQPIPVEMLESKILAVDISIWLHQVVKGFQDNKGSALANAHLLGLFHRLCKLMYYRIKPVFVFDGKVAPLKRETIAKRNRQRSKLTNEADRIQTLLLQSLAKEKVVQQALGTHGAAELLKASPKKRNLAKRPDVDDMFKLPDPPNDQSDLNTASESSFSSEVDSSFEEQKPRINHNQNLQAIDVKSKYFRNLPADIRHEILIDIKETRKQSSWGKLHELPSKSNDFSTFQMKRLLKRRQVQESIEEVQKEMDGARTFTISELENIFTEEGIIDSDLPGGKHISSDSNTRFLLVRDLKKTLAEAAYEASEEKPQTSSKKLDTVKEAEEAADELGEEYDEDLEKALKMSLDESTPYSESDYEYNGRVKLNVEQRLQLKNAAVGLARAYMIEHGGMNDEDVEHLLDHTQAITDDDEFNFTLGPVEEKISLKSTSQSVTIENEKNTPAAGSAIDLASVTKILKEEISKDETSHSASSKDLEFPDVTAKRTIQHEEIKDPEIGVISDSSSDSELEEVHSPSSTTSSKKPIPTLDDSNPKTSDMQIVVDLTKTLSQEDDMFADVFRPSVQPSLIESKPLPLKVSKVLADEKSQNQVSEDIKTTEQNTIELKPPTQTIATQILEDLKKQSSEISKIELKPTPTTNVSQILEDLKRQASEITKINLSDIKLDPSIIEISDDDSVRLSEKLMYEADSDALSQTEESDTLNPLLKELSAPLAGKEKPNAEDEPLETKPDCTEIIEILDICPPKTLPTQVTPSKTRDISEFFERQYVVKRTPDKPTENTDDVPKVASPFFVRKTPNKSSNEKKNPGKRNATDDEGSPPTKKSSKATKVLFEHSIDDDCEMKPLKEEEIDPRSALEIAASVLKENKTSDELVDMASQLAREKQDLEKERNRQDRMGMSITEKMNTECMALLRLFGIPFIVAPMEAEAQCAFLDAMELTNGTITDDSDIWLFGGRTVYKNFFAQNKHVMEFKADKIENSFNVDRKKLIQLALLVGSDYTTGINGIGAVTALEILATFSTNESKEVMPSQQTTTTVLACLRNFRDWWASVKSSIAIGNSVRHRLRNKLKNIEVYEGFPSSAVVEAYLDPVVDHSQEKFCWGSPDVESIREFARQNFGWTRSKTDETLGPVLKKLNEKKSQATIKNYFATKTISSGKQLQVSKRVQNAIEKMSSDYKSDDEKDQVKKPTRSKRKPSAASTSTSAGDEVIPKKTTRVSKKKVNLPTSSDIIPQRQKDQEEMELKKKLAAKMLKQTKTKPKGSKK